MMAASSKQRQTRNIVGKRVKAARQSHVPSLTQDQLSGKLAAEGVQLDRVAIAKMETGNRCAFDFEVKALAAVLKVDANWLLGIETANGLWVPRASGRRKANS
jgi:ribosomal protein L20